jgi:hypothetical protein
MQSYIVVGWGPENEVQQPNYYPLPCPDAVRVYGMDLVRVVKAADYMVLFIHPYTGQLAQSPAQHRNEN